MGTAKDTLADAQTTEAATVRGFLNAGSTGITGGYEIVGIAMDALIHEMRRDQGLGEGGPRRRHRGRRRRARGQHHQRRRAQRRAQPHRRRTGDRPPGAGGVEHRDAAGHRDHPGAPGLRVRQRPGVHRDRPPARRRHRLRDAGAPRRAVVPAPVRLAGHVRRRVRAGLVVVGGRTRRHQRPWRVRAVRSRRPPRHLRAGWRRRVRDAAAPRRRCHHRRRCPAAPLGSPVPVLRPDVGLPSGAAARGRRALRRVDDVPPRSAGRASSGSTTTAGGRCSSCGPVAPSPGCGRATGARRGSATTAGATSSTCATRCRRRPTTSTSRAASARSPMPTACRWWR